ncbi:MAG: hypothetical protein Q8P41_17825 [Pseudomonadota bacterium]|nr:hypothetical protein [Pseudomonadota bacterium]
MLLFPLIAACAGPSDDAPKPDDTDVIDTDTAVDTDTDTDSDDTGEPPVNQPPGAVEIAITPTAPAPGADFSVVIVTPAVDPDGDPVTYTYAWTVDGVAAGVDSPTVPGASALELQTWAVTVTPTDGTDPGPAATASVVVGNGPPSAPGLTITPSDPVEGDDLTLVIDPVAVDPDGDPLTVTITWYDSGSYVPQHDGLTVIAGRYVDNDETFRAVVSVTDGFHEPVVAEASVLVQYRCDALPPEAMSETTFSDARAYHGIVFDDDGTLIGFDGSSLIKSTYTGTRSVLRPGVGYIQQMDRLPDGDFVMGDSTNNRLLRVTSAGGSETLASDVGYVYGVTVGPDGMVYVTNGNVSRVDPATGVVTSYLTAGSGWSAHVVNFNLDSTVMYIGTIGSGDVYAVDLDANLDPVGSPALYASRVGSGWHDGLEVDTCGNLYVADYSTGGFYRVETDGTVSAAVGADSTLYGHGTMWGNGIGGWRDDAIYQPQPYNGNTVREVVIGFKSGDTVRTWNGVAAPW